MDRNSGSFRAVSLVDDTRDEDIINPFGSGPVPDHEEAQFVGQEALEAEPLNFRPGTSPATARSIHQYAQIFGGGSVKLRQDGEIMSLVLRESRDRQLLLDQFEKHLIG
ncbi:MAG: hypothetical protein ACK4QP_09065 [Pseudorhizobium sp.]